jgi:hypothetical protein
VAFFKDDKNYDSPQPKGQKVILILTLAGIVLSISATLSALGLTGEFVELSSRASRNSVHTTPPNTLTITNLDILRFFGARRSMKWMILYCGLAVYLPTSMFLIVAQGL